MKKISLRERIYRYYRKNPSVWISGGEIERLVAARTTYKASNSSRRLRELCEDNLLERKEEKGTVWYRYVPKLKTIQKVEIIGDRAVVRSEVVCE